MPSASADLVGQRAVALGRPRLPPQRRGPRLLLGQQFVEPLEIGFGRAQLLLGVLAPGVQAGNARRFLQHHPPLDRLGGDHRADPALADQRRRMGAGRGVGEQQRDVLLADVAAVDPVGRAGAALDPAGDLALAVGLVVRLARFALDQQRDFGEVARRPGRGAGEDDVLHPAAAQRLGGAFAHHPADRFQQVRLAAAVGADDAGQPRLDAQLGGLDEALEAAEFQPAEAQRVGPLLVILAGERFLDLGLERFPGRGLLRPASR